MRWMVKQDRQTELWCCPAPGKQRPLPINLTVSYLVKFLKSLPSTSTYSQTLYFSPFISYYSQMWCSPSWVVPILTVPQLSGDNPLSSPCFSTSTEAGCWHRTGPRRTQRAPFSSNRENSHKLGSRRGPSSCEVPTPRNEKRHISLYLQSGTCWKQEV